MPVFCLETLSWWHLHLDWQRWQPVYYKEPIISPVKGAINIPSTPYFQCLGRRRCTCPLFRPSCPRPCWTPNEAVRELSARELPPLLFSMGELPRSTSELGLRHPWAARTQPPSPEKSLVELLPVKKWKFWFSQDIVLFWPGCKVFPKFPKVFPKIMHTEQDSLCSLYTHFTISLLY